MNEPTDVDLLLIGKTGNGKSAAGNSILRRNAFKSCQSMSSVTRSVDYEVSEFNGRVIKVVDGPGVGDTRMNTGEAVNFVLEKMEYAIAVNPRGYHAFCFVVRFGRRFTKEDEDTINCLKTIFGQDFVKNFCILVMTCGDYFENDSEESGQTFKKWCKEQEGVFKKLLNECDNRIVLFDNFTTDKTKTEEQVAILLEVVDNLSSRGKRYTDKNFQKAKKARDRIITRLITEEIMKEASLIMMRLQIIQLEADLDQKITLLEQLLIREEALLASITSRDSGTVALNELKSTVMSFKRCVIDEIQFCFRMKKEREGIRKYVEETKMKYEEEIKRQREEFERQHKADASLVEDLRKFEQEQMKTILKFQKKKLEAIAEFEQKLLIAMEEEQKKKRDKEYETLETEYKKVKTENDKNILEKVVNAVSWPFRRITSWFD